MFVAIILLILFAQFMIGYFALKNLTEWSVAAVELNNNVLALNSTLRADFVSIRKLLEDLNNKIEFFLEHEQKIILLRRVFWLKAMIAAVLLLKRSGNRKNLLKTFSVISALNTLVNGAVELA